MKPRHLITLAIACALVAGCGQPPSDVRSHTDDVDFPGDLIVRGVYKICDYGRAVYTYRGNRAGGIVVIPNAPECLSGGASSASVTDPDPRGRDEP